MRHDEKKIRRRILVRSKGFCVWGQCLNTARVDEVRVEVVDKMKLEGWLKSENVNSGWDGHDSCLTRNRKPRLPVACIRMKPQTMRVVQHAQDVFNAHAARPSFLEASSTAEIFGNAVVFLDPPRFFSISMGCSQDESHCSGTINMSHLT